MKIIIDEKVKKYAAKKNITAITIDYLKTKTCWARPLFPLVTAGRPKDEKRFDRYLVDNIEVFASKYLDAKDNTIKLVLHNFLFFKSIETEGVRIWG